MGRQCRAGIGRPLFNVRVQRNDDGLTVFAEPGIGPPAFDKGAGSQRDTVLRKLPLKKGELLTERDPLKESLGVRITFFSSQNHSVCISWKIPPSKYVGCAAYPPDQRNTMSFRGRRPWESPGTVYKSATFYREIARTTDTVVGTPLPGCPNERCSMPRTPGDGCPYFHNKDRSFCVTSN